MDGLWNAGDRREETRQQELSRHRLLRVNLSANGTVEPGDASSKASLSPDIDEHNTGGPHFLLSSITPDNSHTYGFEFGLSTAGVTPAAEEPEGGFTVTIWAMVGTSIIPDQVTSYAPIWLAMQSNSIGLNELWHSFDVNACAIRFQIEDDAEDEDESRSVIIVLAEL